MIKIDNLSLDFDGKVIFKNAQFEIPDNKVTVISGPNGSGKTTLLKIITGSIKPQECSIENTFREFFFLPQKIKYPARITLFDYVSSSFFKNSFKWFLNNEECRKIEKIFKELDIYDLKDVFIENLSSGELQKANIALALLSGADCLLLDEPASNMDLINQIKTLDIIKKLTRKNVTSVLVMHDLNMSLNYGDYFIGLNYKFDIISAEKNDFFTKENLKKIYDLEFDVVKNEKNFYIQFFN